MSLWDALAERALGSAAVAEPVLRPADAVWAALEPPEPQPLELPLVSPPPLASSVPGEKSRRDEREPPPPELSRQALTAPSSPPRAGLVQRALEAPPPSPARAPIGLHTVTIAKTVQQTVERTVERVSLRPPPSAVEAVGAAAVPLVLPPRVAPEREASRSPSGSPPEPARAVPALLPARPTSPSDPAIAPNRADGFPSLPRVSAILPRVAPPLTAEPAARAGGPAAIHVHIQRLVVRANLPAQPSRAATVATKGPELLERYLEERSVRR